MIQFNGTGLTIPPTTAGWSPQDALGFNGWGQGVYPAFREFHMEFNLTDQNQLYELITLFTQTLTGTIVARLPAWSSNSFSYRDYSGTIVRQPEFTEYFNEEYVSQIKIVLLVRA